MGRIYENSTVTITATSAKDDNGGCFFSRNLSDTFPLRISVGRRSYCNGKQNIRPKKRKVQTTGSSKLVFDLNCLIDTRWYDDDVEEAPINKRGWVLQEVKQ
jgi:hypothetical protein